MSNLTRGGVAYNLTESPYRYNVDYPSQQNSITFVFSSEFYRGIFIKKLQGNRKTINQSLSKRFGFEMEHNILCDIKLYTSIEKRGFLIYQNGEKFECQKSIRLDGSNLTMTI